MFHAVASSIATRHLRSSFDNFLSMRRPGLDGEVAEEGLHGDAELFVVAVDAGPRGGLAAEAGAADAGEDGER